jgi:DNA topoisomerase-1
MEDYFKDIVDLKFTANMEDELDHVESGKANWKDILATFYVGFDAELTGAEKALEGQHIKVPDELSDEVCDVCGRQMVVKIGKFGRFLACPGFPDCTFTKPLVIEMPGKCPRCGSRILKRTSRKGYTFYACERGQECGFMSWEVPTKEFCPDCGKTLFKPAGKGKKKPFCINEACKSFVPEDQRGYRRRKKTDETPADGAEPPETVKKTAAKKTAAKKTAAKKPAAKKTTAKKTTTKKKKED